LRIHVGEPELVASLLEYFEEQADCVVAQVGEAEIEVALLGSFRGEAHDAKVEQLVSEFWLQAGTQNARLQ
jgi:hypothetical protein